MAAAFFNAMSDPALARAVSAGTNPALHVDPVVVAAMADRGYDLSSATPTRLTPELAAGASHLITMGCGDACPFIPGAIREDWPLPDPHGRPIDEVRRIRDEIATRVADLVARHSWSG